MDGSTYKSNVKEADKRNEEAVHGTIRGKAESEGIGMELLNDKRLERSNKLENDIVTLLKSEDVDARMAKDVVTRLGIRLEMEVQDFLENTAASEALHLDKW